MSAQPRWDPEQYLRYAEERSRPFQDLLDRVAAEDPAYVVDLGCGPGTLTAVLAERWPQARVEGVDSSPEMVARAQSLTRVERLTFEVGDLRTWAPRRPADVLVSNAALQWVPGHLALLSRLVGAVAPGGWLAFQVPANFGQPSHTLLHALRDAPRWRDRLGPLMIAQPSSHEPGEYLAALAGLGCRVDTWETTYLHVLPGEDAVLEWMKGTGARPVLAALDEDEREDFLDAYGAALRDAYPRQPFGTVLPYRRVFVVAQVSAGTGGGLTTR